MSPASMISVAFVFLLAVVAPFVLYYFVRAEHTQRTTMARQDAEKTARRDTQDRDKR